MVHGRESEAGSGVCEGYGVQGAPWETQSTSSGLFWVSLECISHHTASSGCSWPPSSSTHDSAQCRSVWYLPFLRHITFFLMLSRGICLCAALQITFRSLAPSLSRGSVLLEQGQLQVPVYKRVEEVILQEDGCTNKMSCARKSS